MRKTRVAAIAVLALACSAPPPATGPASCPAPGERPVPTLGFAVDGDPERGAALFVEHCEGCHARDPLRRAADAPPAAPRLDCPDWLTDVPDAHLYDATNRGPGPYGHGGGPPLGERLAPREVADVVAYLRSLAKP